MKVVRGGGNAPGAGRYRQAGEAELHDKQLLRQRHQVYHTGRGGNGDLDTLMERVDQLPVRLEGYGERGET